MNVLKAFLATTCLIVRFSWATVVELGLDNLARTIKSKKWTVVLFYDGANKGENNELFSLMNDLDQKFSNKEKVGFAKLDMRRHPAYRNAYSDEEEWWFIDNYYSSFPGDAERSVSISHETFMNLEGELYWPAKILLFADDFNVYSQQDHDLLGDMSIKIPILTRWISIQTGREPYADRVHIQSPINKEIERSQEERDNSFTFSTYFENRVEEHDDEEDNRDEDEAEEDTTSSFLLETGTSKDADGPFRHPYLSQDYCDESSEWLETLSYVISRYLIYAEAYECLWDDERKAREDEQTNFGPLLEEMNQKVQNLLDETFGAKDESLLTQDGLNGTKSATIETASVERELKSSDAETTACNDQLGGATCTNISAVEEEAHQGEELVEEKKNGVPNLRSYFDELVFGYGRSPSRLSKYLNEQVLLKLGPDAKARREARKNFNTSDIALFERMREYMKVVEDTNKDEELYFNTLTDFVTKWHNILVDFHDKLTRYYVEYLDKNPLASHTFKRKDIEILDMNDPNDFDLLTNYDEFHRRYTQAGVPVVLSNVNMTDHEYTLEYMVEQCGSTDVTGHVQVSNPVGGISSTGWGGLEHYVLDDDLLNEQREEDDDRDLTLEQFVILSQMLDNIYLHDFGLPEDECERILYEETLYGEHQKYRIPSILASYDLFHRPPLYSCPGSWPSIFIGKEGSNSKTHIDAEATGFFMYLVSGRKRWIIANPSERLYLYENILRNSMAADNLGMDKSEAANEFLSERFPLLHRVEDVYEVIQEPGQLIYIPPDSPHAVENLDDIVGIALNLIPRDAMGRHLHNQIHYTRHFGHSELALKYLLFDDNAEQLTPTKDPLYATFAEYKAQI